MRAVDDGAADTLDALSPSQAEVVLVHAGGPAHGVGAILRWSD